MDPVRVLIVEDDERILEIHRRFVEKVEGFETVGVANSLAAGKEMAEVLSPDLILLDLYFPDGYGIDLLRELRSRGMEIDLILITAAKEVEPLRDALRGGIFDYILKPVLFSRFEESLGKYREYRSRLFRETRLDQSDVDRILRSDRKASLKNIDLPKGIDRLTLDKVRKIFDNPPDAGVSAEETGGLVGVSRTTARRYLEYLVSAGDVFPDLVYRKVGRPERRYFQRKR